MVFKPHLILSKGEDLKAFFFGECARRADEAAGPPTF